jgi:glycosyltransferase involved in cell wall biosynthesis
VNERLRIVKVMPFFAPSPRLGGSAAQARLVCGGLAAAGHDVRVLTTDLWLAGDVPRDAFVDELGCRVLYCRTRPWHRVPPYLPPRRLAAAVRGAVGDADIVCSNVGLSLLHRVVRSSCRRAGVPYVHNAEGALCPLRLQVKRRRKALFVRAVERAVLRDAAALQAVTDKEAADLVALGASAERVHVIPNGVDVDAGMGDGAAWRRAHGVPADGPLLLFLGRLDALKGIDVLLAAAAPHLRTDPRARLALVGPDDGVVAAARAHAAALRISDAVLFTGPQSGAAKAGAFAAATVFVHGSRTEGLPNAVLEAMAAGLPLVLTDACNLPEVATAGAGLVVPVDVVAFRHALGRLLADAPLRAQCGAAARALAVERFALPAVVRRLAALYASLARCRPSRAAAF